MDLDLLWKEYKEGGSFEARQALILACLPLAKKVAGSWRHRETACCDYEDFVSAAMVTVITALDKYNPEYKVPFRTYICRRISGSILDEIRKMQWSSRPYKEMSLRVSKTTYKLTEALSRPPYLEELAKELGWKTNRLRRLLVDIALHKEFLRWKRNDHLNPLIYIPRLAPKDELDPEVALKLKQVVNTLPDIEKNIVLKYFWQDYTLEDISEEMKVTPGRVSQLKKLAIQHITEELRFTD